MRTNEERQQLIHRRTLEIQREQQKKRERVISGSGIAACLMIIIGIGDPFKRKEERNYE